MINDNPAARLLAILVEGNRLSKNTPTKICWKKILKVPDSSDNESVLMYKLGQAMMLPNDIQQLVEQYYPQQTNAIKHSISCTKTAFLSQNLNGTWDSFIRHIDSHTIANLEMIIALLDHKLQTKLINFSDLEAIREQVQNLYIDILNDHDLTEEFKNFIAHYLKKILAAIDDYFISGAIPILDALAATLGHAVLDPSFKEQLVNSKMGEKITQTIANLANIVTVATAATGAIAYLAQNGLPLLK